MNLFKKNWYKHFKNGENPAKLADDLDKMRGVVTIQPYNPQTGELFDKVVLKNTLVNQSKTNLIRLISQGQSPWTGVINPANLKIGKMRFGNSTGYQPNKLYYYKITEASTRICTPLATTDGRLYAGGKANAATCPFGNNITPVTIQNISATAFVAGPNATKIFTIRSGSLPPSHGTFKVQLVDTTQNPEIIRETIYFDSVTPLVNPVYPYTRKSSGNYPTRLVCNRINNINQPVCTPAAGRGDTTGAIDINPASPGINTKLFYDYTLSSAGWKLLLEEIATPPSWNTLRVTYEVGKFNIINSIVPKTGYNEGQGLDVTSRYIPSGGGGDFYSVLSNIEYRDCDSDFIDDYSVTFSINMSGDYGNGATISTDYIKYTEAFLFNNDDEIFSSIYLDDKFFQKNSSLAYYISWTILAPID